MNSAAFDEMDKAVVRASQDGLPMVQRPFADVAKRAGTSEEDVVARLERMRNDGIVRRLAAVPNHYSLGLRANAMSVWDVDDDKIDQLGKAVGALDFVTHCYRRPRIAEDWPYNLFAMVHGRTRDEALAKVEEIAGLLGTAARQRDVLFSTRILKKTGFRLPA